MVVGCAKAQRYALSFCWESCIRWERLSRLEGTVAKSLDSAAADTKACILPPSTSLYVKTSSELGSVLTLITLPSRSRNLDIENK